MTEAAAGCWFASRTLGEVQSVGALEFLFAAHKAGARSAFEFFACGRHGGEPMELVLTKDGRGWIGRGAEGFPVRINGGTPQQVFEGLAEQFESVSQRLPPRLEGESIAVIGIRSMLGWDTPPKPSREEPDPEQLAERLVSAFAKNLTIKIDLPVTVDVPPIQIDLPVTVNVPQPEAPPPAPPVKKHMVYERDATGQIVGSTTTTVPHG